MKLVLTLFMLLIFGDVALAQKFSEEIVEEREKTELESFSELDMSAKTDATRFVAPVAVVPTPRPNLTDRLNSAIAEEARVKAQLAQEALAAEELKKKMAPITVTIIRRLPRGAKAKKVIGRKVTKTLVIPAGQNLSDKEIIALSNREG